MTRKPNPEFGKRRSKVPAAQPGPPTERSGHVALLVMGTLAVGGGAYALIPRNNCQPTSPGMAAPAVPQPGADCAPRSSSGSGGGTSSRSSFFSGGSSTGGSSSGNWSSSSSSSVSRGGFGSFAHAFGFGGG